MQVLKFDLVDQEIKKGRKFYTMRMEASQSLIPCAPF